MALDALTAKANTGTGTDTIAGRTTPGGFVGAAMLTDDTGAEINSGNPLPVSLPAGLATETTLASLLAATGLEDSAAVDGGRGFIVIAPAPRRRTIVRYIHRDDDDEEKDDSPPLAAVDVAQPAQAPGVAKAVSGKREARQTASETGSGVAKPPVVADRSDMAGPMAATIAAYMVISAGEQARLAQRLDDDALIALLLS